MRRLFLFIFWFKNLFCKKIVYKFASVLMNAKFIILN